MPPRLNKRQLRELEELQHLEATGSPASEQVEEEEEEEPSDRGVTSGFAALVSAEGDDESEDDDSSRPSKTKKKKKKKKASATTPSIVPTPHASVQVMPTPHTPEVGLPSGISKKEKKALKKQKAKAAKDDTDDLDKALAELSLKYPELKRPAADASSIKASSTFFSLLSVSLPHLDSEAEMRKFFGSKVVSASKASGSGTSSGRRPAIAAKSNLTRPQNTWWPASHRQGLTMRGLTDEEMEERNQRHQWVGSMDEKVWTVEYSRKYKGMTKTFMQMVMSGDPEGLFQILRSFPYHADTLLQLSEVYHHREEHSTAADFIDRSLFTYERAFVGSLSFSTGSNRLDFDRVENRPFFLAIHRQVSDLHRRGCVRTAFEFARLLYSLDPSVDPHGALLHLDFLAIKAGMTQWLLDLWDVQCRFSENAWKGRSHVRALPGWAYARALALFVQEEARDDEEHKLSTNALIEAVRAFPSVVPLLADKADISLSSEVRSHQAFRIHTDASTLRKQSDSILHLLSHLYAQRSFSLWKVKSRSIWFATTVNSTPLPSKSSMPFSPTPSSPSPSLFDTLYTAPSLASSVYRHVVVLESVTRAGRLFGFLPASVTSGKQLACDPLPPPTRVSEYDGEFFQGAEDPLAAHPRGRRENQRMLDRLVPDPVFRRQLQDFFEANPHFAQRFPGGIVEFAQIAGQMPEEILEDLMIEVAAGQGGRDMPGQMPGQDLFGDVQLGVAPPEEIPRQPQAIDHDDEGDLDGESEDDDEMNEVAPLPVRILRNVLNRFWGNNIATNAESSDDDDPGEELRDEEGVD